MSPVYKMKEKITRTESEGRTTGVQVLPPVKSKGDSESGIFAPVAVGVTDERSFPVVVQLAVGDSDTVGAVCDVKKTVVAEKK